MITHKLIKQEYEITDGKYKIYCDIENGLLTVTTPQGKSFQFLDSTPEVVNAIGKMICYASDELLEKESEPC